MSKGGRREGAGRKVGSKTKVGADLRELARMYTPQAMTRLVALLDSEDPRVALGAITEMLNRGHGKPAQAVTGEGGEGPVRISIKWRSAD